jgi:hypothetical protein
MRYLEKLSLYCQEKKVDLYRWSSYASYLMGKGITGSKAETVLGYLHRLVLDSVYRNREGAAVFHEVPAPLWKSCKLCSLRSSRASCGY